MVRRKVGTKKLKEEMSTELQDTFNSYGTLVTVASLILIVVYASGGYDGWDALVSLMGLWFGGYYLLKNAQFDWPSQFLASLIVSCSAVSFSKVAISIWSNYQLSSTLQKCEPLTCPDDLGEGISGSLLISLLVAVFILVAWGKPNA